MSRARRQPTAPIPGAAVGYVRVSSAEQASEGVSLDAQEERVRAYATMAGLDLAAIYRDEGVSAGKPLRSRPAGADLLAAVERGGVTHVIAVKLDRLFRDCVDCLSTATEWSAAGVALVLLDLGGQAVDTSSAAGRFMLSVVAAAAEMERTRGRERTRDALAHKRARGDRLGTTPLGFHTPEPGSAMQPDVRELAAVWAILQAREAGVGFQAIADELNAAGVPTKRGGTWGRSAVWYVWRDRARYAAIPRPVQQRRRAA